MSPRSLTRFLIGDWGRRLLRARGWIALQLVVIALLLLAGLGWTRIPEKHVWQVLLELIVPLILAACFLVLQAGTLRSLLRRFLNTSDSGQRWVSIGWGAATLLLWFAIAGLAWIALDRFDAQIELWSGYLNSRFGAGARATAATEEHIAALLGWIERLLRWIIVPGLLLPFGTSALWGVRRLPWKQVRRVWLNWRWWPAVVVAALIGVAGPQWFFSTPPHGSVSAQVWRVVLKLAASYLLAIASWIAILAWMATLIRIAAQPSGRWSENPDDEPDDLAGVGVRNIHPDGGRSGSVRLPLPERSDDGGGDA